MARHWISRALDRVLPRGPTKHESQIDAEWTPKRDPRHGDYAYREVQPGLHIEVFWKVEHPFLGRGPTAIVYLGQKSMLKFDCLGAGHGHFHVYALEKSGKARLRVFFREQTVEEQIERSVFELVWNLETYLRSCRLERARSFKLHEKELEQGARWMGDKLLEFLRTVPEIAERSESVTRTPPELGITPSRPPVT